MDFTQSYSTNTIVKRPMTSYFEKNGIPVPNTNRSVSINTHVMSGRGMNSSYKSGNGPYQTAGEQV